MDETQTRRLRCGALALLTIPLGIACRMAPLGLPAAAVKYGGSALWAAMLYWLVALVFPRRTCRWLGLGASTLAVGVEFFKLVRTPALDAFRAGRFRANCCSAASSPGGILPAICWQSL